MPDQAHWHYAWKHVRLKATVGSSSTQKLFKHLKPDDLAAGGIAPASRPALPLSEEERLAAQGVPPEVVASMRSFSEAAFGRRPISAVPPQQACPPARSCCASLIAPLPCAKALCCS